MFFYQKRIFTLGGNYVCGRIMSNFERIGSADDLINVHMTNQGFEQDQTDDAEMIEFDVY